MLGLLAGLTQALGMLGAASGEAPVSLLVSHIGWRDTLFVMAVMFMMLSMLLYRFIRDNPTHKHVQKLEKSKYLSVVSSLKRVLSHRQTWINALYSGFVFAPTAVIGESLGPAYLQFGRGLSAHQAAFATGLIFIGWGISGPFSGWLSDKMGRRKPLMVASAVCGIILTALFIFTPHLTPSMIYLIFFAYGLTNTGVAIAYAVSTEIQSREVVGTAIGFTNMASIFVGALMQPLVGKFVDIAAGPRSYHVETLLLTDFQAGIWLLPACSSVALILALLVKETHCRPIHSDNIRAQAV
jgi:sugar phosphate permease